MSKKLLRHLVFWPVSITIVVLCCCFLPPSLMETYATGLFSIWAGLSGLLGLCPLSLISRYSNETDDPARKPSYLLYIPGGILLILFRLGWLTFVLLNWGIATLVRLFDKEQNT